MDTASLGPLTVSRLCLGTMLMGNSTPVDESHRMLDRFVDAGGTFLDTADTYNDGGSEETLAPWLARRRDEVVLATKVRFAVSDPGGEGLAPDRIRAACDASLRRLGVDHIDLYQVHAPDPDVPLEQTLEALDGLVQAGKVRALGASNYPAWLLAWAVGLQDRHGWSPFVSLQPQYSLVERSIEIELLPFCRAAGLGVLPWGPLGAGFLTGRYSRDEPPPAGSRMGDASDDLEEAPARRAIERNFRAVDEAQAIAEAKGATIAQVSLAWLLATEGVTAPIVGPRTYEQLEDLLGSVDVSLSADEYERLGAHTAPPEVYPNRMLSEQSGIDVVPLRRYSAASRRSRSSSFDHAPTETRTSCVPGRLRTTMPWSRRRSRVGSGSGSSKATSVVWPRCGTARPWASSRSARPAASAGPAASTSAIPAPRSTPSEATLKATTSRASAGVS